MRRYPRGFPDARSVSENVTNGNGDGDGIAAAAAICGYAAENLASPNSRWKWALLPLIVIMVSGMGLAFLGDTPGLRSAGLGIFVASAAGYVVVRIVLLMEKRTR